MMSGIASWDALSTSTKNETGPCIPCAPVLQKSQLRDSSSVDERRESADICSRSCAECLYQVYHREGASRNAKNLARCYQGRRMEFRGHDASTEELSEQHISLVLLPHLMLARFQQSLGTNQVIKPVRFCV